MHANSLQQIKSIKINKPMTKQITPKIDMSALVLVDNNCGVGCKNNIKNLIYHSCILEQSRYMTFKFEK